MQRLMLRMQLARRMRGKQPATELRRERGGELGTQAAHRSPAAVHVATREAVPSALPPWLLLRRQKRHILVPRVMGERLRRQMAHGAEPGADATASSV